VLGVCRNKLSELARGDRRRSRIAQAAAVAIVDHGVPLVATWPVMACLNALSSRARAIIERSFCLEETAEEIAAALALRPGNVRVIRHRGLAALRRCLEEGRTP
jgi:RNA polymerase sigma-70 factor (ECF subfamily)